MTNPAESYEGYMVPTLFAPWASRLVEAANPTGGERVLDLACGTGIVARRVARRLGPGGAAVTALDASPHMLAVARAAAGREALAVDWREGRAERLPFEDGSFDLVLCQFGLMFFADRPAALAETRRVLGTGGRLLLSVWQGLHRHPFYETLHAVIRRRVGLSAMADIFSLGDPDELRALLVRAGFEGVEVEPASLTARFPDPVAFLAREIAMDTAAIPSMQGLDDGARASIVAAIRADLEGPLAEVTDGDHVVLPFHAHLARGATEPVSPPGPLAG